MSMSSLNKKDSTVISVLVIHPITISVLHCYRMLFTYLVPSTGKVLPIACHAGKDSGKVQA